MSEDDIAALVRRLRSSIHDAAWEKHALVQEAADALEACQAENERLREVTYQTRMFMWKNRAEKLLERAEKAETELESWRDYAVAELVAKAEQKGRDD